MRFHTPCAKSRAESDVMAVVIRGAGKDFSIGGHRDMLTLLGNGSMAEQQLHDFMLAFYNRWLPMLDLEVPVISVLQGDCIGVAPVFACVPDIAVADETLSLQVTFAGLALYPGMGLPWLLARKVGPSRAALLTMSNLAISGREAERLELVERCPFWQDRPSMRRCGSPVTSPKSGPETVRLLKKRIWECNVANFRRSLSATPHSRPRTSEHAEYRARIAHYLPNHYE